MLRSVNKKGLAECAFNLFRRRLSQKSGRQFTFQNGQISFSKSTNASNRINFVRHLSDFRLQIEELHEKPESGLNSAPESKDVPPKIEISSISQPFSDSKSNLFAILKDSANKKQASKIPKKILLEDLKEISSSVEKSKEFFKCFDAWLENVNVRLQEMNPMDIYSIIVNLGQINVNLNWELRQNALNRWHIQSFETQFAVGDKKLSSPEMYSELFLGFKKLYCPQDYYSPSGFPTYQVVTKTMKYFQEISTKNQNLNDFLYYESLANVAYSLSDMKILLERPELDFFFAYFKNFLINFKISMKINQESGTNATLNQSESVKNNLDQSETMTPSKFLRFITIFDQFGKIFINWQLNPDQFEKGNGILPAWFQGVKSLLAVTDMSQISADPSNDPRLAETMVSLASTCFTIMEQFYYVKEVEDLQQPLNDHLAKWVGQASLPTCLDLHEAVQSCQAYMKAQFILACLKEGKMDVIPDDPHLLNNSDLIDVLSEKLTEYEILKFTKKGVDESKILQSRAGERSNRSRDSEGSREIDDLFESDSQESHDSRPPKRRSRAGERFGDDKEWKMEKF